MRSPRAFTLVEVVVALGLLGSTVLFTVSLHSSINRSIADAADFTRAAQLADAVLVELQRVRDLPATPAEFDRLDRMAAIIPPAEDGTALRLIGARNGTQVIRETEVDAAATRIEPAERYFLVEVRRQPAPLDYVRSAGFLALALKVSWPYLPRSGQPGGTSAGAVSSLTFNAALTP